MFQKIREYFAELVILGGMGALPVWMTWGMGMPLSNPFVVIALIVFAILLVAILRGYTNPSAENASGGHRNSDNDVDDERHNIVFRGSGYPFTDINTPDD